MKAKQCPTLNQQTSPRPRPQTQNLTRSKSPGWHQSPEPELRHKDANSAPPVSARRFPENKGGELLKASSFVVRSASASGATPITPGCKTPSGCMNTGCETSDCETPACKIPLGGKMPGCKLPFGGTIPGCETSRCDTPFCKQPPPSKETSELETSSENACLLYTSPSPRD